MGACNCFKPDPRPYYIPIPVSDPFSFPLPLPLPMPAATTFGTIASNSTPLPGLSLVPVDPSVQNQKMEGWGTSLCWWAAQVGTWDDRKVGDIVRALFGPDGLRMNVVRYNIGGGENPKCKWGEHLIYERKMNGFWNPDRTWNWEADAGQRKVLTQAVKDCGVNLVEAFSNSPPYWMTASGCAAGNVNGNDNNLPDQNVGLFIEYLVTVCAYFREKFGITFDSIDPFNEPVSSWWKAGNSQEGCHISIAQQKTIVRDLLAALQKRGLASTIISSPDTNSLEETLDVWLNGYDAETRSRVGRLNPHSYSGIARYELEAATRVNGKPLWMSEFCCGNEIHYHEGMRAAMVLAAQIMIDLKDMKSRTWVMWQAVESEEVLVRSNINYGLIHGVYKDFTYKEKSYTKSSYWPAKQYYIFGHFSRFVCPGYTILGCGNENVLVASDLKGRVTIVAINCTYSAAEYAISLEKFTTVAATTSSMILTSEGSSWAPLANRKIEGRRLILSLPKISIITCTLSAGYSGPTGCLFGGEHYKILNKNSGKAWGVQDWSKDDGALVVQWTWEKANANNSWKISRSGDGFSYMIQNRNSGKSICATGVGDKVRICQRTNDGSEGFRWEISANGDGSYRMVNRMSGKACEVEDWSQDDGAYVRQAGFKNEAAKLWRIERVNVLGDE